MLTWKYEIAIYLWIAGIAGGAYFSAFLIDRFSGGRHKLLMKMAMLMGVPLVGLGSLLLVIDLGEPLRFWHLFTRFRPGSAMSMGSWILLSYAILGAVMLLLWALEWLKLSERTLRSVERVNGVISWITFVLSVLVIAYTGVLLSASNQALWASSFLVPALFVASGIATGTAIVFLAARMGLDRLVDRILAGPGQRIPERTVRNMSNAAAIVGVVEVLVLLAYVGWMGSFATPAAAEALSVLISGSLSLLFWGGVVLIGLLIPMVLELASMYSEKADLAVSVASSTGLVVIGGLMLRLVMVVGGQI
jgi:polysulfide reductase chain C